MEKSDLVAEKPNGAAPEVASSELNAAFTNLSNALLKGMAAQGGIDLPGTVILMRVQFVHLQTLQKHLAKKGLVSKDEFEKELTEAFQSLADATSANTQAPKIMVPKH